MSVLFAGSENEAFALDTTFTTYPDPVTSASHIDTDFARAGVDLNYGAPVFAAVDLGGITEVWVHWRYGNTNGDDDNTDFFQIMDASQQGIVRLYSNSDGSWYFQYYNGSTWVDIGSTVRASANSTHDIHCKIDGSTGEFAWYQNGTEIASTTGDTDHFSATISYLWWDTYDIFAAAYMSEVICTDTENTVGMRLATIAPDGAGSNSDWTGAYTDIDESSVNDADFISSGTANEVSTYSMGNLSTAAAALSPVALVESSRALIGASGPQNLQHVVRTGGTDYNGSSVSGLTTSFKNGFQTVWDVNPDTAAEWSTSEINALELGVESIT